MKTRKGCWTCKARKVQCDGGLPTCRRCAGARRECQGYEMRLSWPKDDDKKRAITTDQQSVVVFPSQGTNNIFFINTTSRDIELHRRLSLQTQPFHLIQPPSNLRKLPQLSVNHMDLVHYFHSSAYLSLVTFTATTSQFRDALMRMALANNTTPGLALFCALLSFSSLRRNGRNQQAVQLKIAALQSLSASARGRSLTSAEAAQHAAASMLLGAFEIQLPVESSGEWLWYIRGAIDIIQATRLKDRSHESDVGHLLNWVYYHDALSRFSTHHWRRKSMNLGAMDPIRFAFRGLESPTLAMHRLAPPSPNPAYAILNLLSEACDTLLDPLDPRSRSQEYRDRLRALENRIGNLPLVPASAISEADTTLPVEVYQLATRIYLLRASQNPWESSATLDSLIDEAFAVPIRGHYCVHFFPMFILACEARTDERRLIIRNLVDRTEKGGRIRNMEGLRDDIQSIWVQQDLHADSDLLVNYLGNMSAVISSSRTLPSFA